MAFKLAPQAILAGYRLDSFDTVGSTNVLALERAAAGDPGRLWLVSGHQQAGRGRRGRPWSTEAGNLAASLLILPEAELRDAAVLGFVAGLALADALEAVLPRTQVAVGLDGANLRGGGRFQLKWPNDVLADGAKLSGILLESSLLDDGRFALAVGIGVNVVSCPPDTPYPATSLRGLGSDCDAETLFLALSDAWLANYTIWANGRGLEDIRRAWMDRAAGIGAPVAMRTGGRVTRGIFETIDEQCRLVIRDEAGSRTAVAAGDVHFGAVASLREDE